MVKLHMASIIYEMKSHILLKDQLQIRADKEWMPNCSDVGCSESIIRYMASLEGPDSLKRSKRIARLINGKPGENHHIMPAKTRHIGQPGNPHKNAHTPPRRKAPSRLHPGVIVITPPRG